MTDAKKTDLRHAQDLLEAVPPAMRVIRAELRAHAGATDLTVPQFRALVHVARRTRTNGDLADLQGVSRSAMSRMVDVLIDKGLVVRQPSVVDSRSVDIGLTDAGRTAYEKMRFQAATRFAEILQRLPEESRAALSDGMDALRRFVDAYDRSAED